MTDWKGIVKNGWHPEKEGTSIRGQVKGLVSRGDKSPSHSSANHTAAPISTLRDPSSFGPPPKRVGAGSPSPISSTPQYQSPTGQTSSEQQQQYQQPQEPTAESRPYQVNTTGLSTSHLPPPPVRRGSPEKGSFAPPPYAPVKPSGPPSLPPRLPPRSGNASPVRTESPVSNGGSQPGYINQGAVSRLGAAGISVPGLGIGGKTPPPPPARSPTTTSSTGGLSTKPSNGQLNELQSRFSRLGTSSSRQEPTAAPTQGTTWAEKQSAFKTVSSFRKDPSSVSFADAKAAAKTTHNFQQRHGDQVASGLQTANSLNQRYGGGENNGQGTSASPMGQITSVIGKKKPPPPPPSKKPQLSGASNGGAAPPPVPLSTRPKFN
ncbi:hypothetical protein M426DRAFT_97560 [Hypoxylon sp. CI-4A]|nr:hypothetical protein M426DRAFT_97560 [Hypoxylon sp. CI-4A]